MTSPHSVNTLICWEMAGRLTGKFSAIELRFKDPRAIKPMMSLLMGVGYCLEYVSSGDHGDM